MKKKALKVSKVKFVSTVGVHLLTSFWISLVFSQLQFLLPYSGWDRGCVESLLVVLNLPIWFCRSSRTLQAEEELAAFFPLSCGSTRMGGWVWATIFAGSHFSNHTLRVLCGSHFHSVHLPHTFANNPHFTVCEMHWVEQILPLLHPLGWPHHCECEGPAQLLKLSFEKSPLWCCLLLLRSAWLSTHSNSLTSSVSIWVMASQGPSLLPAPGVTWLPNFSGIFLDSDCLPSHRMLLVLSLTAFLTPSDFKYPSLSWQASETSLM